MHTTQYIELNDLTPEQQSILAPFATDGEVALACYSDAHDGFAGYMIVDRDNTWVAPEAIRVTGELDAWIIAQIEERANLAAEDAARSVREAEYAAYLDAADFELDCRRNK